MATPKTHAVFRVTTESDITGDEIPTMFKVERTALAEDERGPVYKYALFEYRSSSYGYLETLGLPSNSDIEEVLDEAESRIRDYANLDGEVVTIERIRRD